MWWVIGGAVYLLLLTLGLLFLQGASKLQDSEPPLRDWIERLAREQVTQEVPRQLVLPFTPCFPPALSRARAGLAAAAIQKISGTLS